MSSVDPDHYRAMSIQPILSIAANNDDFLTGNAKKYLSRYVNIEDARKRMESLEKARQYVDWIIEREQFNAFGIDYYGPSDIVEETANKMLESLQRFRNTKRHGVFQRPPLTQGKIDYTLARAAYAEELLNRPESET